MDFIKLILSIISSLLKGTTNEKNAKENEDGRTEVDGRKEASGQGQQEASTETIKKENEQESLQVNKEYKIKLSEIIGTLSIDSLPIDHQDNLKILLDKINQIRNAYAKPMTVSSGYRSMAEHLEIYRKKGITDQSKIPMKSRHLSGAAIDIYDPNQQLQKWVLDNVKVLEEVGLWCEDFSATPNWVHFQIVPPASGKRFFKP